MKKTLSVFLSLLMLLSVLGLPAWAENAVPEVASYAETVAYVRSQLTVRNGSFTFRYTGGDWTEPTLDDLCAYGGDADAGDYLRLSFSALPQYADNGDGTYTVSAAFYTDARQEAAVDAYVSDVISGCTAETDYDKAAYIYGYLCDNVQFDLENLYNEADQLKYTAYGAAVNGRAVCQGFATLFYRLALAAGLDCRIVTGTRSDVKHAWNIVKWDGKWYHVDASSGSQLLDASGYFMRASLDKYTIAYGKETAREIARYPFASGSVAANIVTGVINYKISWTLDTDTGALAICGEGEMPWQMGIAENMSPFGNDQRIRTVTVSDGITQLPAYLFYRCENLTEISIPASVTSIGHNSLEYCPNLRTIILDERNENYAMIEGNLVYTPRRRLIIGSADGTIPDDGSVTDIDSRAFYGREAIEELVIPEGVTYIGDGAFQDCANLRSAAFPKSLIRIQPGAFSGCTALESISIPANVEYMDTAFYNCPNVSSVSVDENNPYYHTAGDCIIKTAEKTVVAAYPYSEIPTDGSVTAIGSAAFTGCTELTEYTVPEGITKVEGFSGCTNLVRVSLPESLTECGGFSFCGFTELTLPANVKSCSNGFNQCASLKTVSLPEGMTICSGFNHCPALEHIVFPESIKVINGFQNDVSLTEIVFPPNMNGFVRESFIGCTGLTEITIPGSVTIGSDAWSIFNDCSGLETVVVEEGVKWFSVSCFGSCENLKTLKILDRDRAPDFTLSFHNCPQMTVYGFKDSAAERAANAASLPFVELCPETSEPHNVIVIPAAEATCTEGAYSAGEKCADCGELFIEPELIGEPLGHDPAEPVRENVTEPTCTEEGGYDSVIYCGRCGELLSSVHEKLAMIPHADGDRNGYCDECGAYICKHEETSIQNMTDASCTENGYSGDRVCDICGVVLEYGATVYAPGHSPVLAAEAISATCLDPGRAAKYVCSECGAVTTASRETPIVGHADADGDGLCDVCLSPVDSEIYGRCGAQLFWFAADDVLVISGSGNSDSFSGGVPWEPYADRIKTVYIREGVGRVAAAGLRSCPALNMVLKAESARVSGVGIPVVSYTFGNGAARLSGAAEYTLYDLLDTAYLLTFDHEVAALDFETLTLNAADGGEYTEYDILKNGKIIDENHFRIPDGAELSDFLARPLGYRSFNAVMDALGRNPDKNLILNITCADLLPQELKADADLYTEQIAIRFIDEEPSGDDGNGSFLDWIAEQYQATLAALLGLFKKVVKFFKSIFSK